VLGHIRPAAPTNRLNCQPFGRLRWFSRKATSIFQARNH
jgi:hypothetical protein